MQRTHHFSSDDEFQAAVTRVYEDGWAVDPEIGREHPEIEYAINKSRISSFAEFSRVLLTQDLQYTSACIWRLLSYGSAELEALFERMPRAQRLTILDLLDREALRGVVAFREKIDLLARVSGRR